MDRTEDGARLGRRGLLQGAAGLGAAAMLPGAAGAQGVDFSGRTLEFVIPFAEAGGSDVWARFMAPFIARHMPGRPTVIVRNVPGGGSITGTNTFYQRARPDGLSFIGTSGSTQFPFLLGDPRVRYDYSKMTPVLVSPTGGVVYIPKSLGVANASEIGKLRGRELVYGSQGATSLDLVPMLAFLLLGLNVRFVFGMRGRGEARLGLMRGEISIDYQTSAAYLTQVKPMVEAGDAVPLFSWGQLDEHGEVERDPTFPELPHFVEVLQMLNGSKPSGVQFDAYMAFFGSGFAAQKPILLPPNTPANIIATYRKTMIDAVADPELQAKKGDVLGEYRQAVGDRVERLYRVATTIEAPAREWVRNYLTTTHHVRF